MGTIDEIGVDTVTVPVPAELADTFRTTFGARVASVPVRRGPGASRRAAALAARAFTHRGEVFLPDEAGSLGDRDTRALLAHELVHVTQQRRLGTALPAPTSAQGQHLEDVAVATEQWFRGETPRPPALDTGSTESTEGTEHTGTIGTIDQNPYLSTAPEPNQPVGTPPAGQPPLTTLDLTDTATLDTLATLLYRPLHTRLRHELLIDRERSGTLADPR